MQKYLSFRTAFLLSLCIAFLINLLFLIMFLYGRDAVMPPRPEAEVQHKFDFYRLLSNFIFIFCYTLILYLINFQLLKTPIPTKYKPILLVGTVLACGIILSIIISLIQIQLFDHGPFPQRFIRGSIMRDLVISIMVLFSSQIIYLENRKKQMAIENETLLAENVRTRYETLKNQMDPHFLFNSLNTLNTLVKVNPEKAQEYIQQFSSVYRYTLQSQELQSVEEEVKFTMSYCSLMQIRYGKNLQFDFRIDEKYNSFLIVPLSLQTLVENAIKHNVISSRYPFIVSIFSDDENFIHVRNPIQSKKDPDTGEGIGLLNLAERYRLKFRKEISIQNDGVTFEVIIPIMKI